MEKKQTAVEFLYEAIDNELIDFLESRIDINELSVAMLKAKQKALEIEKEQMEEAVSNGISQADMEDMRGYFNFDKWYQQTYGK